MNIRTSSYPRSRSRISSTPKTAEASLRSTRTNVCFAQQAAVITRWARCRCGVLSSSEAVRNILSYQPKARFIVTVRNPVEMAPALHGEMLFSGHENVHDFSAAWDLQGERRQGRQLPPFSWGQRRL